MPVGAAERVAEIVDDEDVDVLSEGDVVTVAHDDAVVVDEAVDESDAVSEPVPETLGDVLGDPESDSEPLGDAVCEEDAEMVREPGGERDEDDVAVPELVMKT